VGEGRIFAMTRPTIGPVHWCSSARFGTLRRATYGIARDGPPRITKPSCLGRTRLYAANFHALLPTTAVPRMKSRHRFLRASCLAPASRQLQRTAILPASRKKPRPRACNRTAAAQSATARTRGLWSRVSIVRVEGASRRRAGAQAGGLNRAAVWPSSGGLNVDQCLSFRHGAKNSSLSSLRARCHGLDACLRRVRAVAGRHRPWSA